MKFRVVSLNLETSQRYTGYLENFKAVFAVVREDGSVDKGLTLTMEDLGISEQDWSEKLHLGYEITLDI